MCNIDGNIKLHQAHLLRACASQILVKEGAVSGQLLLTQKRRILSVGHDDK